jgi:endonuclease/exonuclease/phosphatase family metal-dependent hydrolase
MGSRLRILSANVLNGGTRPDALIELLRRVAPDAAVFQELAPEQAEAISEVLPHGRLEPSRNHHGMGIALRHPGRDGRVELPVRDALLASLSPAEWSELAAPVEIVNVHIHAPHIRPWSALGLRRGQLKGLLAHLQRTPDRPQVVIGDFNATPLWPIYRRVRQQRRDAARAVTRRPGRTWGPGPGTPRLLRIDHAFVQHLEVESVQVEPLPGSDHSALVPGQRPQCPGR